MSGDIQREAAEIFLLEAGDLLAAIEETSLDILRAPEATSMEAVNRLFRAFHTIKGSGGMCGLDGVARFTHHVENALDAVRDGKLTMSGPLAELLLAAKDHIKELIDAFIAGGPAENDTTRRIIAALHALPMPGDAASPAAIAAPPPAATVAVPAEVVPTPPVAPVMATVYQIRFTPRKGTAATMQPDDVIAALASLGTCEIPAGAPARGATTRWDIRLTTTRDIEAVRDACLVLDGDCRVTVRTVLPVATTPAAASSAIERDATNGAGGASSPPAPARKAMTDSVVRVPSEKLDRLVSLVGEMVMNQSRLTQVAERLGNAELAAPVEALERLVAEMRDNVLGIRMMPIGSTFGRFKRLVHDLARELGKDVTLVTAGEDTELDKTVLDQLGDPLVHLIRNSVDHGVETPEQRVAVGKPRTGTIRLTAAHEGSQVVIRIQDDGRGLDAERLRAKAVEKKLIAPDAVLSERDTFNLIFLPGFSTAHQVTNVSGRGVGMDVVKRQLDALHGAIAIESRPGQGTTISLSLPLTLAIIDGLLVSIGRDRFIIPMEAVTENVELPAADRQRNNGRNLVIVRGEPVPYIRLRDLFEIRDGSEAIEKVVIIAHDGHRVGLVVDRVLGSHQTVIQSLGQFYADITVVSGATIMGDGGVALIFDLAGLVNHAANAADRQLLQRDAAN